jgi:DNA-binding IclR family transcriptional regulator
MDAIKADERGGIQVIARAAQVLRSLRDEPAGLSLAEIATRVSLPRSTVQRIVAALIDERLLIPASLRAGVKLGPALVELAAAVDARTERLVRPFMEAIARQTDETVDLSILDGDQVVFVEQIQGTQRLAAVSAVGKRFPVHCTANGKAILAILPAERRDALLAGRLKRYTPATITDQKLLREALGDVRASGLAFDLEEHSPGICAIGTAFLDSSGRAYSLSCPVPSGRFAARRAQIARLLKKTKAGLPAALHASGAR